MQDPGSPEPCEVDIAHFGGTCGRNRSREAQPDATAMRANVNSTHSPVTKRCLEMHAEVRAVFPLRISEDATKDFIGVPS